MEGDSGEETRSSGTIVTSRSRPAHIIYCQTQGFNMKRLTGARDHPLFLVRRLLGSGRLLKQPVASLRA